MALRKTCGGELAPPRFVTIFRVQAKAVPLWGRDMKRRCDLSICFEGFAQN